MFYSILRAVILGIIQGIAEFLPVSSSGHLVIFGDLLSRITGHQAQKGEDLQMNIALHVGTLFSILWIYRDELRHRLFHQPKLMLGILIATVPLVFIGLSPLKDMVEEIFSSPLSAGCGLLVTAFVLFVGQRFQRENSLADLKDLHWWQAAIVGIFQAVAIFPGISRSGTTISTGLVVGIDRNSSANFSFLIAIPALAGAGVLGLLKLILKPEEAASGTHGIALVVGGITAFIVGLVALKGLLSLIGKGRLHYFAIYCLLLGTTTIIWQLFFV